MSELDSCGSWVCSVWEQQKKAVTTSVITSIEQQKKAVTTSVITSIEQAEISPIWQRLIDFFRKFRNDPEKIAVFQSSLLDAKNIWLKQEFDKVLPKIIQESQNDPNHPLSKLKINDSSKDTWTSVLSQELPEWFEYDKEGWIIDKKVPWIKHSPHFFFDPEKHLSDLKKEEQELARREKEIVWETEICSLCWGNRHNCSWYQEYGLSWPYFIKCNIHRDWTISQK
jgi:hypothetical protein